MRAPSLGTNISEQVPIGIQPPGQEFQGMTWSGFTTVPFYRTGYNGGERHLLDTNGVFTLEHLNSAHFLRDGPVPNQQSVHDGNFPYFKFAIGGPKRY
jgi:hypothetical protein